jgi:hypothetical protein
MIVQIVVLALIFSGFVALYLWSRWSEGAIDYEHAELPAEQANALRFGIAMAANQKNSQ